MFPFGEPSDSKAAILRYLISKWSINKLPGRNCIEEISTGVRVLQIRLKPFLSTQWSLMQSFLTFEAFYESVVSNKFSSVVLVAGN